jgi:hypothetical protein
MKFYGLLIQQTISGLDNQYVSDHLNITNPEVEATLTDERMVAQLAKQSDVYCIQITQNFCVYSLIDTNVTDNFKRPGFCAIRLYFHKSNSQGINSIQQHLLKVKDRYNGFLKSNNVSSQNYDDIITSILFTENIVSSPVGIRNSNDAFVYLNESQNIERVFSDARCFLFKKVYVFDINKANESSILTNLGLVSFDDYVSLIKKIDLNDPLEIIEGIYINKILVPFKKAEKKYAIYCETKDTVSYNTKDNSIIKPVDNSPYTIQKAITTPKVLTYVPPKQEPPFPKSAMFFVFFFMLSFIGFGIWYLMDGMEPEPGFGFTTSIGPSQGEKASKDSLANISQDKLPIVFSRDSSDTLEMVYKTNFPKLTKYRFRFKNGGWSYKNIERKNSYVAFDSSTIKTFNKVDSLQFDERKIAEFINALEQASGKSLKGDKNTKEPQPKKDPTIPKKDPTTPKKDPTTPKKDPATPKKDPTTPKKDPMQIIIE